MEIVGESELRIRKREMQKDFVKSHVGIYMYEQTAMMNRDVRRG